MIKSAPIADLDAYYAHEAGYQDRMRNEAPQTIDPNSSYYKGYMARANEERNKDLAFLLDSLNE